MKILDNLEEGEETISLFQLVTVFWRPEFQE